MKTVLLIDDDFAYAKLMGEILKEHAWDVLIASEGTEGIHLAKTHRPHVVICDLLMPRCNGFQVCRTLRSDPTLRHTKVVVTTARDFESDRQAAFEAGADEYLTKPVHAPDLLLLLSRIVPGVGAAETEPAVAPDAVAPVRVTFWGVRGSIPTPGPSTVYYGGNTSCVEVRSGDQIIVLDGGTGLRLLGRALTEEFDNQPIDLTLLLTHTHWDHIQGLPFFLPVYKPHNRLRILGYEGARHGLETVLSSQMESPFFPIGLNQVSANVRVEELKDMHFDLGLVRVESCFANHPGICVGYRLYTARGSIGFFPDNEPYQGQQRPAGSGDEKSPAAAEFAHSQNQKFVEFLRGTDVLIMDTQYDQKEYEQHIGWGHGCLDAVVKLALDAAAKKLFLFHHDPAHDDAKISEMVAHARKLVANAGGTLQVDAAREGTSVEL